MTQHRWVVEIEGMPHFDMAMKRIDAWYENEIIDRPPVRFIAHNAFLETAKQDISTFSPQEKEAWWFDAELQVDLFIRSIDGKRFQWGNVPGFFSKSGSGCLCCVLWRASLFSVMSPRGLSPW